MSKPTFQLEVTSGTHRRMADGSVKLTFSTNSEISTDDFIIIDKFRQTSGWLLFGENEFENTDIPTENAKTDTKTPSQRLRAVLFVMFKQSGKKEHEFESFYREYMEKFIGHVKENLEAKNG